MNYAEKKTSEKRQKAKREENARIREPCNN